MNRVTGVAGTTVMYNANGVMYRVTYAPNGTYRYTAGAALAPMQTVRSSLSTGTSMRVSGGAAPVTRTSGVTLLPTTGGGAPAQSPTLPLLLALVLVGLGLATRRLASHMR
ncbi:MAG: hypothetical protein NVS2B16_36170 [Chloroflexota bacterium]